MSKEFKTDNSQQVRWIIKQHELTNHYYDDYLPYEFHLRVTRQVGEEFKHLLPEPKRESVLMACWGHDMLEDLRVSYNDVVKELGLETADLIFALWNEKGKTRAERANDKYYEGIHNTEGAVFVKLCDRIANVSYGKMTGGSMYKKYFKENPNFVTKLGRYYDLSNPLEPMFKRLDELFEALNTVEKTFPIN